MPTLHHRGGEQLAPKGGGSKTAARCKPNFRNQSPNKRYPHGAVGGRHGLRAQVRAWSPGPLKSGRLQTSLRDAPQFHAKSHLYRQTGVTAVPGRNGNPGVPGHLFDGPCLGPSARSFLPSASLPMIYSSVCRRRFSCAVHAFPHLEASHLHNGWISFTGTMVTYGPG